MPSPPTPLPITGEGSLLAMRPVPCGGERLVNGLCHGLTDGNGLGGAMERESAGGETCPMRGRASVGVGGDLTCLTRAVINRVRCGDVGHDERINRPRISTTNKRMETRQFVIVSHSRTVDSQDLPKVSHAGCG
ncbi:MAG: hypothetical protein HZB19_14055 [Chloroflexi bacterium]|nr:hypothetical protein [Chloroflexota bacterium]